MAESPSELNGGTGETISLEELAVQSSEPSAGASASAAPEPPKPNLDEIFADEDPEFSRTMDGIRADREILSQIPTGESIEVEPEIETPKTGWRRALARAEAARERAGVFVARARALAKAGGKEAAIGAARAALSAAKRGATVSIAGASAALKGFFALPGRTKGMLALAAILAFACAWVVTGLLTGRRLPGYKSPFLESMADVADAAYEFDPAEPMEDFASPLRVAEHVVLLDRVVVNLRRGPNESSTTTETSMGLFEFYVEASSQAAAIEIADRKSETSEAAQKAARSMTFEELSEPEGKQKLKILVRQQINGLLTKGRARRVFYKSIVLKP